MGRALLLNASFEPLCVVPMRRAVVLVLKEKAEVVARNGGELHSERADDADPGGDPPAPLRPGAAPKPGAPLAPGGLRPRRAPVPVLQPGRGEHRPRRAPLARRDPRVGQRGRLVPGVQRPQGGPPPAEAGFRLRRPPREPHANLWVVATAGSIDPEWGPFLPRSLAADRDALTPA